MRIKIPNKNPAPVAEAEKEIVDDKPKTTNDALVRFGQMAQRAKNPKAIPLSGTPDKTNTKPRKLGIALGSNSVQQTPKGQLGESGTGAEKAVGKPDTGLAGAIQNLKFGNPETTITKTQKEQTDLPISTAKYQVRSDLPPEFPKETITEFSNLMQGILDAFDTQEIHSVMEKTLVYLQSHPELETILVDSDISIFVRGARQSYAAVVKAKTVRKKKSKKREQKNTALLETLDSMGFDLKI